MMILIRKAKLQNYFSLVKWDVGEDVFACTVSLSLCFGWHCSGGNARSIFWGSLYQHDPGFALTCVCIIPLPWKKWPGICRQIWRLFPCASLISAACANTRALGYSSSPWDRKWQLFDKCNGASVIKRTKANFLSSKLIKAGAVLGMLLVSLVFLCRGVLLGHFAAPLPILSLFTKSCYVCIGRPPRSGCLCVYVEPFEERGDYIQAFLSPPSASVLYNCSGNTG